MAARWETPQSESSALTTSELDSLADGSESATVTIDNDTGLHQYAKVRVALGSLTPTAGGSVTLCLYGPNATAPSSSRSSNQRAGAYYQKTISLSTTTEAKVVEFMRVPIEPFEIEASIVNNAGVAFAGSANDIYVQFYNEDFSS